jgi:hypothetical protein
MAAIELFSLDSSIFLNNIVVRLQFTVFDGFEEGIETGIYSLETGIVCSFSNCKLKNEIA